ncbi:MAG: Gfo/Idh/MocA family oxidoreductase, partial [Bacteroidota bacterium]|nr:Gfo/Idh/MocA family oxidoreductase [Bacteroidota bacterium]
MKRRTFLKSSAATAAGAMVVPTIIPSHVMGKNAPSNKIRIGQIGFGRIARSHDLPETLRHNSTIGVAVADVDLNRARMGKEWIEKFHLDRGKSAVDVAVYQDYREMLQDKSIDAVIISTPDHWHAQPAMETALAGKDIYLQKPASLTIAEGRQMSDIVHRTGVIFQQGSQQRGTVPWPHFHKACTLVRNGRVGELQKIEIGLPGDPGGDEEVPMPVPENLDYDLWLGSTPFKYYTEKRVHPHLDFSRPGWLRCEQFGAGMITGWGAHHLDTAHWAMGTEYTGPVEVEAEASFPASGLWNVHGDFMVHAKYANGVTMQVSGDFPNGVKFYGSEGWIFVSRGSVAVTSSDPTAGDAQLKALDASDPKLLEPLRDPNRIQLYKAPEQHED